MYFSKLLWRAAWATLVVTGVTACGGGGSATAPNGVAATPTLNARPSPPAVSNAMSVTVDLGPAGNTVNRMYTAVTICSPASTTQCQTIDHVLVDTGSSGLRLLSSALAPGLNLKRLTGAGGQPLLNCAQFVDNSFAWGPVATADIVLGAKTAASVPIQIMADPAFGSLAGACSSGTMVSTAAALGANGILGLGLFKEDCGASCSTVTNNGTYYTCASAGCTSTTGASASLAQQIKNPVPLFAADNNGVLIDLPGVGPAGASSLTGALIFGIGTQSNNQMTSGGVLTTSAAGAITTLLSGQTLNTSFFDTGSNGLYFDSAAIPICTASGSTGFYCPSSLITFSVTLVGANAVSIPISFSIDNALALFGNASRAVLPTLSGPVGDAHSFDWGLPFFYGRRVFIGIEGQASSLGTGPYFAF